MFEHRLGVLEPEDRSQVTIKAVTETWATAGGRRQLVLAEWRGEEPDTLTSFVTRATTAYRAVPIATPSM